VTSTANTTRTGAWADVGTVGTYAVQKFVIACTTMIANTLRPVLANNQVQSTRNARAPKNPRTIRVRP